MRPNKSTSQKTAVPSKQFKTITIMMGVKQLPCLEEVLKLTPLTVTFQVKLIRL